MRKTPTATATTAFVTALVVPEKQQVKPSVHNVMYILLYTRTAVVLVVDAHNEVSGISTVGIIRTVIYEYI